MIISLGLLPGDMHRLAYRTHPVPRAGREMFWLARLVGKGGRSTWWQRSWAGLDETALVRCQRPTVDGPS